MFSIVIPARLNSQVLKNTIIKVLEQTYLDFEVLVILDFESDNLIQDSKITYLFSGIKSPGEKRNIGIDASKGEYIAFLDDDAYPKNDWLYQAKSIFDNNPDFFAVCGPSLTPNESTLLEKIGGYIYESFLASGPTRYRHLPLKHRLVDDCPTVNLIVKKQALSEVGGFDTKFWPGEDTKLCLDLVLRFGKKIYYSPVLQVFHFRRTVFHPHLIQLSRYATHRGFFAKKFPHTSFRLSYFIPSIFVFYLIFLPFFLILGNKSKLLLLSPLITYFFLLGHDFISIYFKSMSIAASILGVIGIVLSNLTYGIFFIKGLFTKPELVLREVDLINEKYIKG